MVLSIVSNLSLSYYFLDILTSSKINMSKSHEKIYILTGLSLLCLTSNERKRLSQFKTTTPRSSRIGQEGHSTDKDWIRFTEKYRPPCMKFLDRHYPKYRFLKDDVYEDMVVMILDNPGFANRKPSVRFRTVLIKMLRKAMVNAVRKLREESGERYARLMLPLLPAETAFDCDRRRLQLIAVDFIRREPTPLQRTSRGIQRDADRAFGVDEFAWGWGW